MASTKNKTQRHTASIALHMALQIAESEQARAIIKSDIYRANLKEKRFQISTKVALTFSSLLLHVSQTISTRL